VLHRLASSAATAAADDDYQRQQGCMTCLNIAINRMFELAAAAAAGDDSSDQQELLAWPHQQQQQQLVCEWVNAVLNIPEPPIGFYKGKGIMQIVRQNVADRLKNFAQASTTAHSAFC
jgi:hypothetical protein